MKNIIYKGRLKLILLLVLGCILVSCAAIQNNSKNLYLSFPEEVNTLIDEYIKYKKGQDVFIEFEKILNKDSCELYYEITLNDGYPKKEERFMYDRFNSSNTFIRVQNKDIPIIHNIDARFQHYFEYPISDVVKIDDYTFVIIFTDDKLICSGWNRCKSMSYNIQR